MIEQKKFLSDSISILVNRLTQSITSFVLLAAIARLRGSYELGQYVVAFSYYFIFMTIASQSLKILLPRELSRHPEKTSLYLVNGTLLQVLLSCCGYLLLLLVVSVLPYRSDTTLVCYTLGLMIFPFSVWNITEAIFLVSKKMYWVALSTTPVYILRTILCIWMMTAGHGTAVISIVLVATEFLVVILQWLFVARIVKLQFQIDWALIMQIAKSARILFVIEGVAVVNSRIQLVILSLLAGEVVVGIYGGITQLLQPFQIVANSVVSPIFPAISKLRGDTEQQRKLVESGMAMLLSIAFPLIVTLFFQGSQILEFVYRDPSFAEVDTQKALWIISFTVLTISIVQPLSFLLVANNLERFNLYEVSFSVFTSLLVGLLLIPKYQIIGAAATTLIVAIISATLYIFAVHKYLFRLHVKPLLDFPILASVCILPVFLLLEKMQQGTLFNLGVITLCFAIIVTVMYTLLFGDSRLFSRKS